ncbi:hypothetical protein T4B_5337 [Trichinella pseudospiralis]|uniref:Uncharacterized protein n=1 Tax=Trichinella pseudospiralis TaxID=6337 RepID=A0A0V1JZU6_TRIPS|nr:hypothetical protein T4B_2960 [Trichinella pseudospiralis]KRZ04038.1 hypothetical protein T4B_5337 [Trichinella pseudospiralis]KRZ40444.1 hypothetical protein T4C_8939 [Trichinella pseudospiralis]
MELHADQSSIPLNILPMSNAAVAHHLLISTMVNGHFIPYCILQTCGEPKVHVPITFNFCLHLDSWRRWALVTYHEGVFNATAANPISI